MTQKQKSKLETKLQSEIVNNSSNQTTKPPVMEPIINKIKTSTKVSSDIYDIYDDEMMIDHVANQNILSTEVSVIPSSKSIKKKISKEEAKVAVIFSDDEDEDIDNKALDQVDSKPLLKGLFSNIKKGISFVSDFGVSSKEIPQSNPKEHVIPKVDPPKQQASVASILGLGFTSNNISKSVSKPHSNQQSSSVSSSKVIHRDIFSNSFNKVVDSSELELDQDKKQGDVFGLHGNYDIYPETGDFEVRFSLYFIYLYYLYYLFIYLFILFLLCRLMIVIMMVMILDQRKLELMELRILNENITNSQMNFYKN